MTSPLTPPVSVRLELLFDGEERDEARRLLEEDGDMGERTRIAALKLSDGSLDKLVRAIELAQTDFRDLLVAAGFAHDVRAHLAWMPE